MNWISIEAKSNGAVITKQNCENSNHPGALWKNATPWHQTKESPRNGHWRAYWHMLCTNHKAGSWWTNKTIVELTAHRHFSKTSSCFHERKISITSPSIEALIIVDVCFSLILKIHLLYIWPSLIYPVSVRGVLNILMFWYNYSVAWYTQSLGL